MNVQYQGVFLDGKTKNTLKEIAASLGTSLSKSIEELHITFTFKPKGNILSRFDAFVGESYAFDLVAYANNGMNEGFLVRFSEDFPAELKEVYEVAGAKHPHFTLSINSEEGAKAKDTTSLFDRDDVVIFEEPLSIIGQLGYCGWDNNVSFERKF